MVIFEDTKLIVVGLFNSPTTIQIRSRCKRMNYVLRETCPCHRYGWNRGSVELVAQWHLYRVRVSGLRNILRPRQSGCHFTGDIFKCIFMNKNIWILFNISLKFVPRFRINNISALVQIMAWCRPGDNPLSEQMRASLLYHVYASLGRNELTALALSCSVWAVWLKLLYFSSISEIITTHLWAWMSNIIFHFCYWHIDVK